MFLILIITVMLTELGQSKHTWVVLRQGCKKAIKKLVFELTFKDQLKAISDINEWNIVEMSNLYQMAYEKSSENRTIQIRFEMGLIVS